MDSSKSMVKQADRKTGIVANPHVFQRVYFDRPRYPIVM
jgi:hypothetical protein